jgi:hypothetical protein
LQLPLLALLEQWKEPNLSAFQRNFVLLYLEMGIKRTSPEVTIDLFCKVISFQIVTEEMKRTGTTNCDFVSLINTFITFITTTTRHYSSHVSHGISSLSSTLLSSVTNSQ